MNSSFPPTPVHVKQTGTWQSQLVIDFCGSGVSKFCDDDLRRVMPFGNFTQEYIRNIAVYKCPLNDSQLIQLLDNHQFVILETGGIQLRKTTITFTCKGVNILMVCDVISEIFAEEHL